MLITCCCPGPARRTRRRACRGLARARANSRLRRARPTAPCSSVRRRTAPDSLKHAAPPRAPCGLVAVDDAEHLLAHLDEIGARLDRARVARLEEAAVEIELVGVRDAARAAATSRSAGSPRNSASSTLWVMKKNILLVFCQTSSSSSWMVSRVSASSAAIGSSISSIAGSQVSARAMPTRCCMPPESW